MIHSKQIFRHLGGVLAHPLSTTAHLMVWKEEVDEHFGNNRGPLAERESPLKDIIVHRGLKL